MWLQHVGVNCSDLLPGQTFNLSQLAPAAAVNGQGIAMGRAALVLDDLVSGRLVDVFQLSVPSTASYVFVTPPNPWEPVLQVQAWLQQEAQVFRTGCQLALPHLT